MADITPEHREEEPARRPRPAGIPTDPAELEAWKREFTDDLMSGEPGGIGVPWRKTG